jgi:TPR repeat protein
MAAERDDAYSAYRYSKLIGRLSEAARSFWLKYSAILGLGDSYGELAELLDDEGNSTTAAYYAYLAAESQDTDAIVNMAKRWYEGVGVEAKPEYARWYLDKLSIPPISAIKLAYKLRSVHKEAPPRLTLPSEESYLKALADTAARLNADAAYFRLNSMLSELGNINAMAIVGVLLSEGKGAKRDTEGAKRMLDSALAKGNAAAAVYLADCYAEGESFDYSPSLAIEYYKKAASLGYLAAYERLGDIHREGALCEKNIRLAVEYYEAGAALESSKKKAEELKAKRREFYERGSEIMKMRMPTAADSHDAFRSLAIATAMGERSASLLLAECYKRGFGTKKDHSLAFYWYKFAFDEGNADALLPMALCYARGEGVAFSYKNAVRYLSVAQERGASIAAGELDKLLRRRMKKMIRQLYSQAMSLLYMRKYEEAFTLLLSSAPLGYPKALYTLGCLYEFGVGTKRSDRISAAKYYDMALSGNENFERFSDPMSKYKLKILKMIR